MISPCFGFILFSLISYANSQRSSCLRDMKVLGSTTDSITVGWNYTCYSHDVNFKVYYEHSQWNACGGGRRDEQRGPGRGNVEVAEQVAVLENLHPYSLYKLSMKALASENNRMIVPPEEMEIIGETRQSLPGVAPISSPIPVRATDTTLRFTWRDPPASLCQDFRTEIDGTFYIFTGTDPWNVRESQRGSVRTNSVSFDRLSPFSSYVLFIYSMDSTGRYNENIYFKIPAITQSGRATPPRDLSESLQSLKSDRKSRMLQWLPPYPPTGEVEWYTIRWKEANASLWSGSEQVPSSSDLCEENSNSLTSPDKYERPICHLLQNLDPEKTYTFQVSCKNKGVALESPWSLSYISPSSDESERSDSLSSVAVIVVIVSLVGVVFLLMMALIIKSFCCKRNDSSYKNVPNYERARVSSPLDGNRSIISNNSSFRSDRTRTTFASSTLPSDPMRKYQHHLLPMERLERPVSIQEQPLPPLPSADDHMYEELRLKKDPDADNERDSLQLPSEPLTIERKRMSDANSEKSLDEDAYLTPRKRKPSTDTLDIEDYLRPTFNQFETIDTKDMSPPTEAPPPIPKVSYSPVKRPF